MSTTQRTRMLCLGSAVVFAFTLLAPVAVTAEEEIAALAPVVAPAEDGTGVDEVQATRAIAAQRALLSGDIGSMQEEALLAIVAAAPSWDETSGYGSVEASRAAASALVASVAAPSWDQTSGYGSVEASRAMIGHPAAGTIGEDARVLAAQQALLSHDLGSMQEDALTAVVEASIADAEASGDDAVAPTYAQRLAQFRAVELSLGQSLGADQQVSSCSLES